MPDLISFVMVLLKMSKLLGATEAPEDEETKKLMVKCFFYLVTSGISQLNKAGHEEIHQWALQSPDRVYAIGVDGHPDVSAYIRIKAGNSKAGRGTYKRSLPFFNMRFPTYDDALGILLGTADMLDSLKAGKLIWTVRRNLRARSAISCLRLLITQRAKGAEKLGEPV